MKPEGLPDRRDPARIAAFFTLFLAVACSTSNGAEHGPTFDVEGGTTMPGVDGGEGPDSTVVMGGGNEAGTDAPLGSTDGGGILPNDSASAGDANHCTSGSGTMAIVAGDGNDLYGATQVKGAPWNVVSIANGSAASAPGIVTTATGFHAVMRANGNVIKDSIYTSSWSAAAAIAGQTTTTNEKPALALVGTALHLVYWGGDSKLYHGTYGTSWDTANDPVGGAGALQDFGPSGPTAATSGTTLVVAFDGSDHFYDRSYTNPTWQTADQHAGTSVYLTNTPPSPSPTLLALTGGTADLMVVYLDSGAQPFIYYSVRDASAKTWSTPAAIDADAASNDSPTLAALPGGKAVLTWRGTNNSAYFNTYDPSATPAWKPHAFLITSSTTIASAPSVATGVCGDDAVAAITLSSGGVQITRLRSGTWGTPEPVGSLGTLAYASIATAP